MILFTHLRPRLISLIQSCRYLFLKSKHINLGLALFLTVSILTINANAADAKLDKSLKPEMNDEVASLFENVVAVQRKAKVKSGKWLLFPYFSFDFSDSPYTMYGFSLTAGRAIDEYWEVYLEYTPFFVTTERSLSKKVRALTLSGGQQAEIRTEKAKSMLGVEINWVPIYGKDSWGPYGIIRSDTFLNIGIGQVSYEINKGMKYKLMIGKTFFISDLWNLRLQAGASYVESITDGVKDAGVIGQLEGGLVYYF